MVLTWWQVLGQLLAWMSILDHFEDAVSHSPGCGEMD